MGGYALFCKYLHDAEFNNDDECIQKNKKQKKTGNSNNNLNNKNEQNENQNNTNATFNENKYETLKNQEPDYLKSMEYTEQACADLVGDIDVNNNLQNTYVLKKPKIQR